MSIQRMVCVLHIQIYISWYKPLNLEGYYEQFLPKRLVYYNSM